MSCLDATFTLTPQSPSYAGSSLQQAQLLCYGADFFAFSPQSFYSCYSTDTFYFDYTTAADPNLDYTQWANRKRVPFLNLYAWLISYGPPKQLALIFGFDATSSGPISPRVLVYSDAGLLSDQTLMTSDNQFLLIVESLSAPFNIYFIHAGGSFHFKGLSGYLV